MSGPFSLSGRRALVTGANSGIGRAVALGLATYGADLILHHFGGGEGVAALRDDIVAQGRDAAVVEADFTRAGAVETMARDVRSGYGPVDILVANAAIEQRAPWTEVTAAHLESHIAANFASLLTLTQALVPTMVERGWGRVVAMGSVMATRPRAETVIYAALKSAQLTAIRAIAREVAGRGVTMNVISPGAIETARNAERYADPDFRRAVVAKIPAGRAGRPEDIVGAAVLLCSDAGSYITGADIPINGGWTIGDAPGALPEAA